uniref:AXH domain-containing protein n=1 Tax=Denticeps clupeoides TaxID=299321 RepID=A0AAY4AWD4_9TELE
MKSNQERNNECLPPKKRDLLVVEERTLLSVGESQRGENLAWLASVASMASLAPVNTTHGNSECPIISENLTSSQEPLSMVREYTPSLSSSNASSLSRVSPPLSTQPTVYSSNITLPGGTIQYTPLPQNVQLIGPYTGYISSPIIPSTCGPVQLQRPQQEAYVTAIVSQASNGDQQHHQQHQQVSATGLTVTSPLPTLAQPAGQCIQIEGSPLGMAVTPPATQLPVQLHPHSTVLTSALTLTPSQVLLQYTDNIRTSQAKELVYNGTLADAGVSKQPSVVKAVISHREQDQRLTPQSPNLQTRTQVILPAEYTTDCSVLHNSLGKPIPRQSRDSTFSVASTENIASAVPATITPHALLQTSHRSTQELAAGLFSATPLPIIGYISSSGHQQSLGDQTNLTQHLVISSNPSLLIPVTSGGSAENETALSLPQTYKNMTPAVTLTKSDATGLNGHHSTGTKTVIHQTQIPMHDTIPVSMAAPSASQSPLTSPSASLPPYFMKGSIIQLADGLLKRVEDLRTEDFIHSAEVSSELKIDSSTVERIDCSHTPDLVIIHFSVGEHRALVRVEVLVEYPFFVFGQGWSSCCPDRTTQLLALTCAKLSVGDVCVSLTLKSLRNGSLHKEQTTGSLVTDYPAPFKPSKDDGPPRNKVPKRDSHENGVSIGPGYKAGGEAEVKCKMNSQTLMENGGPDKGIKITCMPQTRQTDICAPQRRVGRKRRWSAPEKREADRSYEEPPMTLPKPSFISQEVKISIEGRSRTGH